jgi:DNA-binding SARP family transcriptional activator
VRRKDLALLTYLCIQRSRSLSRGTLASLLWGESSEEKARHSLTQALRRLRQLFGADALNVRDESVDWRGEVQCDAAELECLAAKPTTPGAELPEYREAFLSHFSLGPGAQDFEHWADARRAHYRGLAVRLLDAGGAEQERLGSWSQVLRLGLRVIEIEPLFEEGHRRVMRAWSALGERTLALKHYEDFVRWLQAEFGEVPDPLTVALADQLRSSTAVSRDAIKSSASTHARVPNAARPAYASGPSAPRLQEGAHAVLTPISAQTPLVPAVLAQRDTALLSASSATLSQPSPTAVSSQDEKMNSQTRSVAGASRLSVPLVLKFLAAAGASFSLLFLSAWC